MKPILSILVLSSMLALPSVAVAGDAPMAGEEGTLASGANGLGCPSSRDQFHAMLDAIKKRDGIRYFQSLQVGGVMLSHGDRILVLDRTGILSTEMHIRMLTGDNADSECWTLADTPNAFR